MTDRAVPDQLSGRPLRVRRKKKRILKVRPPIRDLVAPVRCELTIPFVFLMLARRLNNSVKAYPHSRDATKWCFRFGTKALVELSADGSAEWISGSPEMRRDVDDLIACARERFAETLGTSDAVTQHTRIALVQ